MYSLVVDIEYPVFQSTHPARGATLHSGIALLDGTGGFQSTHPARGATLALKTGQTITGFQSTHPARGATPLEVITSMPS